MMRYYIEYQKGIDVIKTYVNADSWTSSAEGKTAEFYVNDTTIPSGKRRTAEFTTVVHVQEVPEKN